MAPPEVFDDLVSLGGLEPGARLVEIGCGTGQATIPLAERGFAVTAVELGSQMAAVARQNVAAFPDVEVVTAAFEEWDAGGETFDGVVSFNAFHWIDPDVRFAKPASLLRDGGALGVFGSRFVVADDSDPAWVALDDDYVAVTGKHEPRLHVSELRDRSEEFTAEGHFAEPHVRRYDLERGLRRRRLRRAPCARSRGTRRSTTMCERRSSRGSPCGSARRRAARSRRRERPFSTSPCGRRAAQDSGSTSRVDVAPK